MPAISWQSGDGHARQHLGKQCTCATTSVCLTTPTEVSGLSGSLRFTFRPSRSFSRHMFLVRELGGVGQTAADNSASSAFCMRGARQGMCWCVNNHCVGLNDMKAKLSDGAELLFHVAQSTTVPGILCMIAHDTDFDRKSWSSSTPGASTQLISPMDSRHAACCLYAPWQTCWRSTCGTVGVVGNS